MNTRAYLLDNKYKVECLLGEGGLGHVLLASDAPVAGHFVAIKVFKEKMDYVIWLITLKNVNGNVRCVQRKKPAR